MPGGPSVFVWTLHRRDTGEHVADLEVVDADLPWLHATVVAYPGLEPLRPLFADQLALLEAVGDDAGEAWDSAYRKVIDAVVLRYPYGREVPEFLLHIDGDRAWWCWTDEQTTEPISP